MKVRFKSKVTRGFFSRRFATRARRFAALSSEKKKKTSGTRVAGLIIPRADASKFKSLTSST